MRIRQIRTLHDTPAPNAKPADNVFVRDRVDVLRHARIDVDDAAFAAGGGGLLQVRIKRRHPPHDLMQELAEDGIHLQRIVVSENAHNRLRRQTAELRHFVIGKIGHNPLPPAAALDRKNSH